MGMLAVYRAYTDEEVERFQDKDVQQVFEIFNAEFGDDSIPVAYVDDIWDGLHFILTGKADHDPNLILSAAIFGVSNVYHDENEYLGFTSHEFLGEIVAVLESVDIQEAIVSTPFSQLHQNQIYPNIWGTDNQANYGQIVHSLVEAFEILLSFYQHALHHELNVLINIS